MADTPQAMAENAIRLLEDAARRETVGAAGRRYVEQYHNWDTVAETLARVYREAQG